MTFPYRVAFLPGLVCDRAAWTSQLAALSDEAECTVSFKGPGYSADAFIDRESGRYQLSQSYQGFIAVINDLHKGRDTGKAWSVVIDVSAVILTLISMTGLVLIFFLKLRRRPGLVVSLVGAAVLVAICLLWVP